MKKSVFSFFSFVLFLSVLSASFTACNKDDDDGDSSTVGSKITATVSGVGSGQVDTVVLYYSAHATYELIAKAAFKNNGFTMELPETLPSRYLETLKNDMPAGVAISDASAKGCFNTSIRALKNDSFVGDIEYLNFSGKEEDYKTGAAYVELVFVDRDVTITGTDTNDDYTQQYNCNLKKGWNYIADVYKGEDSNKKDIYEATTSLPGGLKWYFSSNY